MEQEILKRLQVIEYNTLLAAKKVLDLSDVAALTGMSKSTLYKLTSEKKIPHGLIEWILTVLSVVILISWVIKY